MQSISLHCPLCGSAITRSVYERVVGLWDERKKLEDKLHVQIKRLTDERHTLANERKRLRRDLQSKYRQKTKIAVTRGVARERGRAERLSQMIESKSNRIRDMNQTILELKEQLRKGTTPQLEGLNLEDEIAHELKGRFPSDRVQHFGKKGDILHTIIYKKTVVGSIIYECKRTERFSRSYVSQARRAMVSRSASYAVLVTTVFPGNSAGFLVSQDVFVVHPYGTGDLADFLRRSLIEVHSLEVGSEELNRRSKILFQYMRGDEFRNAIQNTIHTTHALRDLLEKEMRGHFSMWKTRWSNYRDINSDISLIQENASRVVHGDQPIKRMLETKALPPPKEQVFHVQ